MVHQDKARSSGHKLEHSRVHLNIRKHFIIAWVTEHWHRLTREINASPSLEIFISHLNMVLGNLFWVALLQQELDLQLLLPTSNIL